QLLGPAVNGTREVLEALLLDPDPILRAEAQQVINWCDANAQVLGGITPPIVNLVVVASDGYASALVAEIARRRGEISTFSSDNGQCEIRASISTEELSGHNAISAYQESIWKLIRGTGWFTVGQNVPPQSKRQIDPISAFQQTIRTIADRQ